MNKIIKIEALRGFVALYVALSHLFTYFPHILGESVGFLWKYGDAGVAIFFVISGFVIKLSHSRTRDKSFKSYFCKRFFRIYVPLIFVFIATYIIQLIQHNVHDFTIKQVITSLLMLQNVNNIYSAFFPLFGNGPLWSLAYEWWYYMIFFLLMKYLPKQANVVVYSAAIVCALIYINLPYPIFIVSMIADMSLWWLGVAMADLYLKQQRQSFVNLRYPLLTLVAICSILAIAGKSFYVHFFTGIICIVVGLVWYQLGWKFFGATLGRFLPLSKISYTIYIAHFPFVVQATYLDRFDAVLGSFKYLIYFLVMFAFCYLIEVVLYPPINRFFMSRIFPKKRQLAR